MPRVATGSIIERRTSSGVVSFAARFRAYGQRRYITLGYSSRGWTRRRAETELANILADVRRGTWRPPEEIAAERRAAEVPRFGDFLDAWLGGRRADRLAPNTLLDLEWRCRHLRAFFVRRLGNPRLDALTAGEVDAYRRWQVARGRLGATSTNATISTLVAILDLALEHGHLATNPARGRRRRLPSVTPARPWLEPPQVLALLDAARELDAEDVGRRPYRAPLIAVLAYGGLRIGELLALRWRDVSLADCAITVRAGKTAAAARVVDLQPEVYDDLSAWRATTRHGRATDLVFPTSTGRPGNRHSVRKRVILRAVERARERGADLPDGLSPHAFRRSFASWLLSETGDVSYVQMQLGHVDPTLTLAVYSRALASKPRRHHARRHAVDAVQDLDGSRVPVAPVAA